MKFTRKTREVLSARRWARSEEDRLARAAVALVLELPTKTTEQRASARRALAPIFEEIEEVRRACAE